MRNEIADRKNAKRHWNQEGNGKSEAENGKNTCSFAPRCCSWLLGAHGCCVLPQNASSFVVHLQALCAGRVAPCLRRDASGGSIIRAHIYASAGGGSGSRGGAVSGTPSHIRGGGSGVVISARRRMCRLVLQPPLQKTSSSTAAGVHATPLGVASSDHASIGRYRCGHLGITPNRYYASLRSIAFSRKALSKLNKESRPRAGRWRCFIGARRRDETSISTSVSPQPAVIPAFQATRNPPPLPVPY